MPTKTQEPLRRLIHPQVKIIDTVRGIVDYVASDETLDSYNEIIRANGWRFTNFQKNAPFVDSHDYSTLQKQVGKVIDFRVEGRRLINRVQWAIDVAENQLAQLGWKMTAAGYLKAVSVGFHPIRMATRWDSDKTSWAQQLKELNMHEEDGVRAIYIQQEQVELSACILGANPNALAMKSIAHAYKAGVLVDNDIETLSVENAKRTTASTASVAAPAELARERQREEFLRKFEKTLNS